MEPVARDKESMIPILCQSKFLLSWLVNEPPPNVPPPHKRGFNKALLQKKPMVGKGFVSASHSAKTRRSAIIEKRLFKKKHGFQAILQLSPTCCTLSFTIMVRWKKGVSPISVSLHLSSSFPLNHYYESKG